MQSRVMCNNLCGVKVNIMEGRPLVAIGRNVMDQIRYRASRCSKQYIIQEGGRAEAEQGEGWRARFMWKCRTLRPMLDRQSREPEWRRPY